MQRADRAKRKGRHCLVAPFFTSREAYLLGVVVAVVSITAGAGAGAMAGAEVSIAAASSFLAVHAARTSTAATRARRFMYNLLKGKKGENRRSVHGPRARFWRGRKSTSSGSSVKGRTRLVAPIHEG